MMPLRLHLVVCLRSDERRETADGCIGRAGDGVVRGVLCAVRVAPLATARVRAFVWVQCWTGPDSTGGQIVDTKCGTKQPLRPDS